MSVCQSPNVITETLSVCEHGIPIKLGCAICNRNGCQCLCHAINQFMCINCGNNHVDGSGAPFIKKHETITIKKSLWDEMLEYKKKVDELEQWSASCSVCYPPHPKEIEERFEKLEELAKFNMSSEVQQLFKTVHDEYRLRIEALESKLADIAPNLK